MSSVPSGEAAWRRRQRDMLTYQGGETYDGVAFLLSPEEIVVRLRDSGGEPVVRLPRAAVRLVGGTVAIPRWLAIEKGLGLPTREGCA